MLCSKRQKWVPSNRQLGRPQAGRPLLDWAEPTRASPAPLPVDSAPAFPFDAALNSLRLETALALLRQAGYTKEPQFGEILWVDEFAAPGYGQSNADADEAAREVAEVSNFRTETTYISKTLAMFRKQTLQGRRVLFWNTYSAVDPDPSTILVKAAA